jgi:release factor glutamine methyltransferase
VDIRNALRSGISRLRHADVPSYTLAAELLLLHVLHRDRTWIYAHPEDPVDPGDMDHFLSLIDKRAAGQPTQHLTGNQEFWGLSFEVTTDVLIPRPETEHVIEVALDRLALRELRAGRPQKSEGQGSILADIGTGSGCLAIALAKEFPQARIFATDISAPALAVAERNATRHGLHGHIDFIQCDLSSGVIPAHPAPAASSFDLIVSNPPYVSRREAETLAREVRDHEPQIALFGGEEGYELYAGLISLAAHYLKPGGVFVCEMGHNSLPAVRPLLEGPQWIAIGVTNDLSGIPRVIAAELTEKM